MASQISMANRGVSATMHGPHRAFSCQERSLRALGASGPLMGALAPIRTRAWGNLAGGPTSVDRPITSGPQGKARERPPLAEQRPTCPFPLPVLARPEDPGAWPPLTLEIIAPVPSSHVSIGSRPQLLAQELPRKALDIHPLPNPQFTLHPRRLSPRVWTLASPGSLLLAPWCITSISHLDDTVSHLPARRRHRVD